MRDPKVSFGSPIPLSAHAHSRPDRQTFTAPNAHCPSPGNSVPARTALQGEKRSPTTPRIPPPHGTGPASGGRPLREDSGSTLLPEQPRCLGRPRAPLHLWRPPSDHRAPSPSALPARPDPSRSPEAASARTSTHPAGRTGGVRCGGGGAKC